MAIATKGYWKLAGNSNDYSGNGSNGSDTTITYTGSGFGAEAQLTAVTSKIAIGNPAAIQISGAKTYSLMFTPNLAFATDGIRRGMLKKGNMTTQGTTEVGLCRWYNSTAPGWSMFGSWWGNGTTTKDSEDPSPWADETAAKRGYLPLKKRYYAAVFVPSTSARFFFSGKVNLNTPRTASIISATTTDENFTIGSSLNDSNEKTQTGGYKHVKIRDVAVPVVTLMTEAMFYQGIF
jgi:hypothetical protein